MKKPTRAALPTVDDQLLAIAREHLNLDTLQTSHSGADFQEQAVWTIESALRAAFEAGRASVASR